MRSVRWSYCGVSIIVLGRRRTTKTIEKSETRISDEDTPTGTY